MKNRNKFILLFLSVCIYCCASIDPALLSKNESATILNSARSRILNDFSGLSEEEKEKISTTDPIFDYYCISGPKYAEYSITWKLNETGSICIMGKGNLFTLENAVIKRVAEN